jgi:hypothetical protein
MTRQSGRRVSSFVAPTEKLSTASTLPSELQAIAFLTEETSECGEQELNHSDGQAEKFYRDLMQRGICMWVDMGATGYSRWFERLLAELGFELWIGDPDARSRWKPDHPSIYSSTVCSASASTLPVTRSCPFGSLISIVPTASGEPPARPDLFHEMSDKVTGRSLLDWFLPNRPSRLFDDAALLFDRSPLSRFSLGCPIKDGLLGCVHLSLVDT